MGKITVETCEIEGLKVITPAVFGDERGYFVETYNYNDYKEAGIDQVFVQDNQSSSVKNVLRVQMPVGYCLFDICLYLILITGIGMCYIPSCHSKVVAM